MGEDGATPRDGQAAEDLPQAPEDEAGQGSAEGIEEAPEAAAADLAARARQADDYLAQLQRLKADFDNYRRRMMQEQARWSEAAVGRFVADLLPVADNLERAAAAGGDGDAVRRGVELTLRQLTDVLAKAGVEAMTSVGRAFDPNYHEAMAQVETGDHPDGHVIEELRKGYLFKRQVLRPALVKVARAPQAPAGAGEAADGHGAAAPPHGAGGAGDAAKAAGAEAAGAAGPEEEDGGRE